MRLHVLEMEAFGPFAGATRVDFDTLSEAGLFLLSGATGAGKTSVLDAVCFALYGDVPGDRSAAKRLRCDQAEPSVAPRVHLEVTLGVRRFRIERSPAWDRPKRRGAGTTRQQASVTMSELRGGAWTALSSRVDETGDLVGRLVGMSLTQFTQVALLPQGRFQTFLRAGSDERHQLLQRLFRTGRFAEVERWLRERRLELSRADQQQHRAVAEVVSRVSEAAATPLPDDWDIQDLGPVADADRLTGWAEHLHAVAAETAALRATSAQDAARSEQTARTELETARADAARRQRYDTARAELARLDARAEDHSRAVETLAAARRAAGVVPLQRHAETRAGAAARARVAAEAADTALSTHLAVADDLPHPLPGTLLEEAAAQAGDAAAAARALLPRAARQERARAELVQTRRTLESLTTDLAGTRAEQAALPSRLASLRSSVALASDARARIPARLERIAALTAQVDAHAVVARLGAELATARQEWLAAREVALSLKEHLISLQQARVEGMAAELAGALASGCSCPVCGSGVHPAKASAAPGAPDAAAEKHARAAADDAAMVETAFDAKVREVEASLAAATARAGETSVGDLRQQIANQQVDLRQDRAAAEQLVARQAALDDAEQAADRLGSRLAQLSAEEARAQSRGVALTSELDTWESELAAILDDTGHHDLATLVAHHERTITLARAALARRAEVTAAERELTESEQSARAAALEVGFDDAAHAISHARTPRDVAELEGSVETHLRRLAAVSEVLAEPGAALQQDPPHQSLDELVHDHASAMERRDDTGAALRVAVAREQRLAGLVGDLGTRVTAWAPLREELALTTGLSSFVEGKSADNQLRMRLSAYVLAYRLSQVVDAANERLATMSDQRYSLEHTGHRGAGETRGGLSLLVRDDWSGETRDPATLSGGETFVVSLALALGLSDVVAHESGGASLDTLFVDEGFGSLDADTLDDVMDTLDSLRDGGRVVGVVSHVAEMRDRIPTQLVVTKARGGSSVRLRHDGPRDPSH
jgi:exonuclease SbcC